MTDDLAALTEELHRTTLMLGKVLRRLDAAEKRANRQSLLTRLLAGTLALSVVLNGAFFVYAMNERERICAAMRGGFDEFTDALVVAGDEQRTQAEQDARDKQEAEFRADVERRLADC